MGFFLALNNFPSLLKSIKIFCLCADLAGYHTRPSVTTLLKSGCASLSSLPVLSQAILYTFLNKVAISTLSLSTLPSEVMLGCTQEEIGRTGWCAVCINSWNLPAFVFLCAPSCHWQNTLQQFILVWDDKGHVDSFVDVHESCCRVSHSHPEQMLSILFCSEHSLRGFTGRRVASSRQFNSF